MKLSYEIRDSHGGDNSDWTALSRNADINVWEEPAVSILVSTLKMEANVYSETSVTTRRHNPEVYTAVSHHGSVQNSVCCAVGRAWLLLADSRPVLWKHCNN